MNQQLTFYLTFALFNNVALGFLVATKYGLILGSTQLSRNNHKFFSYRGIPYAKAPIGNLRFRDPQPPNFWLFKNARNEGPICIQKNDLFETPYVEGQEDCLYLNIYVPAVHHHKPLPVLVFIHWGAFFTGRGTSDYAGPEYLMDKNIIVVTLNYRLGIMGFFSTLDDSAPGNFGLKDQSFALKFIKENIRNFGGDPNRITISGQSAGAASVGLHLVSPLSKNLFNQAISQSASGLNSWFVPANKVQPAIIEGVANFTGCGHANNSAILINCLRNIPAEALVPISDSFKFFWTEPFLVYLIVTENKTALNPNPFITKVPQEYVRNGEFMNVPYIIGLMQNEGNIRAEPLIRQSELRQELNNDFQHLLIRLLGFDLSKGAGAPALYENVANFFLGGNNYINITDPNSIQGLVNLYSDRLISYDTYETIIFMSKRGYSPIWVYNFDYKGSYSYGNWFAATNETVPFDWGVSHCDDLLYLYRSPGLFPDLPPSDLEMSQIMVTLWTDFVIHGNPDHSLHVNWGSLNFRSPAHIKNEYLNFLNITGEPGNIVFINQTGLNPERIQFWIDQDISGYFKDLNNLKKVV